MASQQPITVVFGTASFGNYEPFISEEYLNKVFSTLEAHKIKNLDTAQLYGKSEERLGEVKAAEKFTIDTKWTGGWTPGWATKENIISSAKESLKKLGTKQVDIFYIHCPDPQTPLEETLEGVNEVYKTGAFKRFGLSNYSAEDVQKVYDTAKAHGWVLPTVYQGNYNPVARKQETVLFPTLRKLGISFYAYSPLAGGFLTKTAQQVRDGAGRFGPDALGGMYRQMYARPSLLDALDKWAQIAEDEGASRAELAYRWVTFNSPLKPEHGDAIIVGASSVEQLEQSLTGIEKGPLSDKAVKAIDEIWEQIKHEAPLDNFAK
ncbi:alcohol dehydrogenase [Capronia coronata CBS 617.96]|uniref:Alcohol dehydrogenase n=1 Tax=Capronia coronata CBS 617.96 TaxID=1182541 RepID=W9YM82_9EURO|nr:alcohol dehydrogenase [Capronia coronata CBS 617.96]EXJ83354.1 alcohol dehydrogenase [Capronia coronata CBS 617.96]